MTDYEKLAFANFSSQLDSFKLAVNANQKLLDILTLLEPPVLKSDDPNFDPDDVCDEHDWGYTEWDEHKKKVDLYNTVKAIVDKPIDDEFDKKQYIKKSLINSFLCLLKDPSKDMCPYIPGYFKYHTIENRHVDLLKQTLEGEPHGFNNLLE